MPTPLTRDEVLKIADLANLCPTDEEIERLRHDLAAMLEMASKLKDADLEGVEPMTSPVETVNRLAEDTPGQTFTQDDVTRLAPDTQDGCIRVPKVLGEGDA